MNHESQYSIKNDLRVRQRKFVLDVYLSLDEGEDPYY
jgi:hypothetical protein